MSATAIPDDSLPEAPVPATVPVARAAGTTDAALLLSRIALGLLALVAVVALVVALALWQRVGSMQEQLARQSADSLAQATEARTLARQAQETVRDTAARLALAETRVGEVALQRSQLEELMHILSRSRD